jgi:hypothetical protein
MLSGGTARKVAQFHPFRQVIPVTFVRRPPARPAHAPQGPAVAACDLRLLPSPRYL